uniref:Retrovirus-related Pol polyprotein from transposon TNT 1-94 n=1 Tax=Tanacetum cinerariifolium TaxID=118510 RepID=A0A699JLW3_TANCI|nr:retrovirus-related Pol polyprotein from transposon TNT 1-94 [Tanacetum cinerariifolium]
MDSGASRHISNNRGIFHMFKEVKDGERVFMGNSQTARVLGKGKVLLKFTSGKSLALNNVLYVPLLCRNMVFESLLLRVGLKIVLEGDKVVITRTNDFVRKGYVVDGLFVFTIHSCSNASSFVYTVESPYMWHDRFGNLNLTSIKKLKAMNLIDVVNEKEFQKCEICVEAKYAKKSFKNVTYKRTQLLKLIHTHTDLVDFKNIMSKWGKKYYITFVDDYLRYTKVYLLRSKGEAEEMFLKIKAEVENQLDQKIK